MAKLKNGVVIYDGKVTQMITGFTREADEWDERDPFITGDETGKTIWKMKFREVPADKLDGELVGLTEVQLEAALAD